MDILHCNMQLLSSPDANIHLVHFFRKVKGSFITENKVVTKYLINFKLLYVFT